MARKEKDYHHGDLRNALLHAAAELVMSHGVEGFSLRAAARQVGVSPTACYRHFSDKANLLNAVAIEGFSNMATNMEQATSEISATQELSSESQAEKRFFAVGRAYVTFAIDHPAQFRVMFGPYGAGGAQSVRGVSPKLGKDPYEIFVDSLNDLLDDSIISPDSRANAELPAWATIHGLSALLVDGLITINSEEELAGVINMVIDTIIKGLKFTETK